MNDMSGLDTVTATELGVDADEEKLGIAALTAITFKQVTIVVLETDDGFMVMGSSTRRRGTPPNPIWARSVARQRAKDVLAKARARSAAAAAEQQTTSRTT